MMDVKVSKDENICRWVDQENLIYVTWNRIKNRADEEGDWQRKKKEDTEWSKASWKLKNLQSFLEMSFMEDIRCGCQIQLK